MYLPFLFDFYNCMYIVRYLKFFYLLFKYFLFYISYGYNIENLDRPLKNRYQILAFIEKLA